MKIICWNAETLAAVGRLALIGTQSHELGAGVENYIVETLVQLSAANARAYRRDSGDTPAQLEARWRAFAVFRSELQTAMRALAGTAPDILFASCVASSLRASAEGEIGAELDMRLRNLEGWIREAQRELHRVAGAASARKRAQ